MTRTGTQRMRTILWSAAVFLSLSGPAVFGAESATLATAPGATMKAISFTHFGDSSVLQYGDLPRPVPGAGEVLVRVRAASVNPADWKSRAGQYARGPLASAVVPGFDVAGDVVAAAAGVTAFKTGDAVYAMLPLNRSGGYAQFVSVPVANVATKPQRADYIHAAAVPLAALTAWQALFDVAKIAAGQTVSCMAVPVG